MNKQVKTSLEWNAARFYFHLSDTNFSPLYLNEHSNRNFQNFNRPSSVSKCLLHSFTQTRNDVTEQIRTSKVRICCRCRRMGAHPVLRDGDRVLPPQVLRVPRGCGPRLLPPLHLSTSPVITGASSKQQTRFRVRASIFAL